MQIKYLGTAAWEGIPALFCDCEACKRSRELGGRNIRTRSQAIIDDTILIDFPPDTYMHFILHNVPMEKIKTCLITHSHEDHLYAADIGTRKKGFSQLSTSFPMRFYADKSGYDMINATREKLKMSEAETKHITHGDVFEAEGYTVTALRAAHDPASCPLVFIIEKDGKSIFYSNDTSEYPPESWEILKKRKNPISLISLDCTSVCSNATYIGHLTLSRCIALRSELIACGAADEKTVFVLNHFSHNGESCVYDDFVKIAEKEGFLVSYDGMTLEI